MSLDSNPNAAHRRLGRLAALFILSVALSVPASTPARATPYGEVEARSVETKNEAKIRDLRNQEITQLRITLGRRLPANRQADLYFRLAEIYLEAYRAEFLIEGRIHEKHVEAGMDEKFINRERSKQYLEAGVKACNDIVRLGIQYEKMDRVYYFLGTNYAEMNRPKESLQFFEKLTQKYPNSIFVGEAYRELGDDAFSRKDYPRALTYYELSARKTTGENLPRLLHRLAWGYYRTRQYDRAVETMKQAISKASASGEKLLSVKDEALRDMAVFMTETGRVDDALSYFQNVAGGDTSLFPKLLEKLGRQYERNVEPDKAALVYETLLKTHPEDEAAFRVSVKLVDLDLRRKKYTQALERLKALKLIEDGEAETTSAANNLRAMIRRTATDQHEIYRKQGDKAALATAESYYEAYIGLMLAKNDPRKETPEIQMYLAEVKRELGKSKDASELYRRVIDSKDSRYAKEAGALWTASLADAIRRSAAGGGTSTAGEPSALEKEFIEASDEMQENLGDVPESREAAIKAAQVLAGYKDSQPAALKRSKKIIERWPSSPQALIAARLWLQILDDSKASPEETGEAVQEIRKNSSLMESDQARNQGKLKQQLSEIESRLKVGQIAQYERDGNYESAAKSYEDFATQETKRDVAEKAYTNAVASYTRAGNAEAASRVAQAWLARFPDSKQVNESIKAAATLALIQGRYPQAAELFEKLGKTGSAESLNTAARIQEAVADREKSQALWNQFLKQYPKTQLRWNVALLLAESQQLDGKPEAAIKTYQYCMDGPFEIEAECGARLGDIHLRAKNRNAARAVFKKLAEKTGKKKGFSPFIAYARYRIAELMEQDAKFQPLKLPEKQLKRALEQRLSFLEPLSKAYLAAVEAGGPWGVAALDRLATFALNFANEVDQISPPEGASPAVVTQFGKNLLTVSDPLRKRAIQTWSDAYQKAIGGEILSPVLPAIADRLADARNTYKATIFPFRAQGFRGRFRLAGVPADGGEAGREKALDRVRDKLARNPQDSAVWIDYGNLLWGEGRPLLAKIAYDRALDLDPKSAAAFNNRAVVTVSGAGEEDWFRVTEAYFLLKEALSRDDLFLPSKMNRAALLNYYRLFKQAKPIWDQVLSRVASADGYDGLAVALQGQGNNSGADAAFGKASELGADAKRFVKIYHEAARNAYNGKNGAEQCYELLNAMNLETMQGFEKHSADSLRRTCRAWKSD